MPMTSPACGCGFKPSACLLTFQRRDMSEKLDHMKDQKEKAEQKLRYYQHQEKCWSTGYQS